MVALSKMTYVAAVALEEDAVGGFAKTAVAEIVNKRSAELVVAFIQLRSDRHRRLNWQHFIQAASCPLAMTTTLTLPACSAEHI